MNDIVKVACGSCRACCQNIPAVLLEDEITSGLYQTQEHALGAILAKKENGDCVYLGEKGCTIYGNHPYICRNYSCVGDYKNLSDKDKELSIQKGILTEKVLEAGKERSK